jgi:hypothetical protein
MKLTDRQIALVKAMLNRGDRQHDIAALFGVNGGRVADVATGKVGKDILPAKTNIPPPGRSPYELRDAILRAADVLAVSITALDGQSDQLKAITEVLDRARASLIAAAGPAQPKKEKPM